MANKKFSDLTAASSLSDADLLAIETGGNSRKITASNVKTYMQTGISGGGSPFPPVKGTTAGTAGTGAFTPNAAASGARAWSTVATGWMGVVKYVDGSNWEFSFSYWNGTTLSRASTQVFISSTGSQLTLTSAATAELVTSLDNFLAPSLEWRGSLVTQGRTTSIAVGTSTTGSTGGATFSDAAYINPQKRTRYTSATTANALAGFSDNDYQLVRSATSTYGGFAYRAVFGTSQIPTGPRLFAGLSSDNGLSSNEPSEWVQNTVAFGKDSTDTNIHFLSNDASGAGAKTDTGIAFPAGAWCNVIIWAEPGASVIHGVLARRDNGDIYYGQRSTNLPTAGAGMAPQLLGGLSATTGTAIQMEIASMLHRAPFNWE